MKRYHIIALAALVPFLFYLLGFNYVAPGKAALALNVFSGEVALMEKPGFYGTAPWVVASRIETRPQRMCITSGSHAAVNCRLVRFDTRHYREFLKTEGWGWYWWSNRISFNMGHEETYRGWRDILRGYAFAAEPYPFVVIMKE